MYSFTVKPFFVPQFISSSSSSSYSFSSSTSSSSISLASFSSRSLSSISFPRNLKHRGRFGLKVEAYDSSNNDASNPASAGDPKPPNGTLVLLLLILHVLLLTSFLINKSARVYFIIFIEKVIYELWMKTSYNRLVWSCIIEWIYLIF